MGETHLKHWVKFSSPVYMTEAWAMNAFASYYIGDKQRQVTEAHHVGVIDGGASAAITTGEPDLALSLVFWPGPWRPCHNSLHIFWKSSAQC